MKSFKISRAELDSIYAQSGITYHDIKAGFIRKDADNMHCLIYLLLTGKDIYKHYHPKDEGSYLVRIIKGDFSPQYPHYRLMEACRQFLSLFRPLEEYSKYYTTPGRSAKIFLERQTRGLITMQRQYNITFPNAALFNSLQPYIKRILEELVRQHENHRIDYQGRSQL